VEVDNTLDNSTQTDSVSQFDDAEKGYSTSDLINLASSISLLLIAIFAMLLVIGQNRTKNNPFQNSTPFIEDESFYSEPPQVEDMIERPFAENQESDSNLKQEVDNIPKEVPVIPPIDLVGIWSTDGNEWVEHPLDSGQHWFRKETGSEWLPWEQE
jgi:hypothetical protein